ncbi:uncharacterized protein [Ptychodera flava]|uniref:uncharacterized protein n=1 Tax=Ptychodera flava TaxID=63121 RepID=UPI003969FF44
MDSVESIGGEVSTESEDQASRTRTIVVDSTGTILMECEGVSVITEGVAMPMGEVKEDTSVQQGDLQGEEVAVTNESFILATDQVSGHTESGLDENVTPVDEVNATESTVVSSDQAMEQEEFELQKNIASDEGVGEVTEAMALPATHQVEQNIKPVAGETVIHGNTLEAGDNAPKPEQGANINQTVLIAALENLKEGLQHVLVVPENQEGDGEDKQIPEKIYLKLVDENQKETKNEEEGTVNAEPATDGKVKEGESSSGEKETDAEDAKEDNNVKKEEIEPEDDDEDEDDDDEEDEQYKAERKFIESVVVSRTGRVIKRPAHFADSELDEWSQEEGKRKRRRRMKESAVSDKPFSCDSCEKSFVHEKGLEKHQEGEHAGPHKCEECDKEFPKSASLKAHEKIHLKEPEKPFKCSICGKAFPYSSHLTVHVRTHTGEKPYQCEYCGKGFVASCDLKRHIRSHQGLKPHNCSACEKSFSAMSDLKRHMKTHSGKKSHKCPFCEKLFARADSLRLHIQLLHEENNEAYQCGSCDKIFMQIRYLRAHQKYLHEEEGPYTVIPKAEAEEKIAEMKAKRDAEAAAKAAAKVSSDESATPYNVLKLSPDMVASSASAVDNDILSASLASTDVVPEENIEAATGADIEAGTGAVSTAQATETVAAPVKNIVVFLKQEGGMLQGEDGEIIGQTVQQIELPLDGVEGDISAEALQEVALQAMQQISAGENVQHIVIHQVTNP